jgi:hypothetical protein
MQGSFYGSEWLDILSSILEFCDIRSASRLGSTSSAMYRILQSLYDRLSVSVPIDVDHTFANVGPFPKRYFVQLTSAGTFKCPIRMDYDGCGI